MPLGLGSGLWGVALPIAKDNLLQNPSGEYGTFGWGTVQAGTVGTTSQYQQFGAWSGSVAPTSNGTSGAYFGTFSATNGQAYTVSAYVRGAVGIPYILCVTDTSNANRQGSVPFTGGGTWQRVNYSFTEASGGTRRVIVQKDSSADTSAFYVDGVMVEVGSLTTYIDGYQDGCSWNGAPNQSTSTRSGQSRAGGSLVALADLGFAVNDSPGAGMPSVENSAQSYAVIDGAQYQRTRAAQRQFTLTAKPILGTTTQDYHITRRTIIDIFKIDAFTPQQPTRFYYVGGQGTVQIDAVYDSGLEEGARNGPMAEDIAVRFMAYQPYWEAPTQQGTSLAPNVSLGSVNYMARRNPQGQWGTVGVNGSVIFNPAAGNIGIYALTVNAGGTVFLAGNWGTLAGTVAPHIGMYFPNINRFGTLVGGTIQAAAQATSLALNPSGTLFIGGNFDSLGGTAANAIGRWFGAFGTLQGGTISATNGLVWSLLYSPLGTLFFGGPFASVAGTTSSRALAMWTGAFGTLGGTIGMSAGNPEIRALAWGLDNRLFFGGVFGTVNGTVGTAVGFWKDGAFGTMGNMSGGGGAPWVYGMAVAADGKLYQGGGFTNVNGGSALRAAVWNGVAQAPLGLGLGNEAWAVEVDPLTGDILYGGAFTSVGSISASANYTRWNGASFVLPDIAFVNSGFVSGTIRAMAVGPDQSLYIGGDFAGTTYAAALGTVVNLGRAAAYPTLRLRNNGAGTTRLYQLVNTTTGAAIYFNYSMLPGEVATLTLQPGARSFTSEFQGNVFGKILPGSNLATWNLLPGTNYLSFFADNTSLESSFYWTPSSWSSDGGTVF